MKTYSSIGNAKRAIKKQNLLNVTIKEVNGRFGWVENEVEEAPTTEQAIVETAQDVTAELVDELHTAEDNLAEAHQHLESVVHKITGEAVVVPESKAMVKAKLKMDSRIAQNGVRQPVEGGLCRAVWDWCDTFLAGEAKRSPVPAEIKLAAESHGWNQNNASIEMYQWRKFNGITGRVTAS